jgi:hypothetical protein
MSGHFILKRAFGALMIAECGREGKLRRLSGDFRWRAKPWGQAATGFAGAFAGMVCPAMNKVQKADKDDSALPHILFSAFFARTKEFWLDRAISDVQSPAYKTEGLDIRWRHPRKDMGLSAW